MKEINFEKAFNVYVAAFRGDEEIDRIEYCTRWKDIHYALYDLQDECSWSHDLCFRIFVDGKEFERSKEKHVKENIQAHIWTLDNRKRALEREIEEIEENRPMLEEAEKRARNMELLEKNSSHDLDTSDTAEWVVKKKE